MFYVAALPRFIYCGDDIIEKLREIEGKRVFVETDRIMVELGFLSRVLEQLKNREVEVFSEVEPSIDIALKAVEEARSFKPDLIVALGRGSCIDVAKTVWVLYENPGIEVEDITPFTELRLEKKAKLVAIPTTSGTGSEMSFGIALKDLKEKRKVILGSHSIVPYIVILDPFFPSKMPKKLTAATDFDVLAHAVKSYVTPLANEFTEALSLKAFSLIFKLPVAYREPDNMIARLKVHVAATLAGMAFSNSGLEVAHSIAHAIGGLFNIPHGVAVGVALLYSVLFNASHTEKYCDLAEALKLKYSSPVDAAKELVRKLFELRRELESPLTPKEVGIP